MITKKIDKSFIVFTFPAVALVLIITIIPFALNFYYSFFKWDGIGISMSFVGLKNFIRILTKDKRFIKAVVFTLKFSVFYVSFVNILAFTLSLKLKDLNKFTTISRSFIYIPHIISLTAVGLIWRFIFGPGFEGLYLKIPANFFNYSWLGDSRLAYFAVLIVTIWQNVGFYMIIYIAGLKSIPKEMFEAAAIDGASGRMRLTHIILPLMMPALIICTLTSLMYAFKLFDIILVLTKGGPAGATNTIAFNIYEDAFTRFKFGMATAKSVLFFLGVMLVTLLQLRLMKSKEIGS